MRAPRIVIVTVAALLLSSCSLLGGDDSADDSPTSDVSSAGDDASNSSGDTPEVSEAETTTTTEPPILLALSPDLALQPGQCFADQPPPIETTTTEAPPEETTVDGEVETTTTTIATTTEPTAPTTTQPRPPTVAVVDCSGTTRGVVYATMCLGSLASRDDPVIDRPEDLGQVACPGEIGLGWPGDRLLRRAGARVCLSVFEDLYGESYAVSEISTEEFVPSKGVWQLTDRRLVCAASEPPP